MTRSALGRIIARSGGVTAGFACVLVILLSFLTVADVFMRAVLGNSIRGMSDLTLMVVMMITALCFPIGSREGGHVKITFLGAVLPRLAARAVETFAQLLTCAFLGIVAWQAVRLASESLSRGQITSVLGVSLTPFWVIASLSLSLAALIQLYMLTRLISGHDAPETTHPEAG